FNARGPSGLINGKAPGNQGKLSDVHRQALAKIVESGPIPAVHGVVRGQRKDLVQWLFQEYRISVDETTIGRELKALGFAKLSARPRHYGIALVSLAGHHHFPGDPGDLVGQRHSREFWGLALEQLDEARAKRSGLFPLSPVEA
ncbi:hypothetical protein GR243_40305, partial [Rhizobium leguminosarum]|nr:hypothetical protein [Rhizobium leguminosarum]